MIDIALGRKGLLNYLRLLGGSNIVKIVPANGSVSESQATAKKLKVICGSNTSTLEDQDWITERTRYEETCEIRVSPHNSVILNICGIELAEALSRVIPFTATKDDRPVLACVFIVQQEGKLKLVSADGFVPINMTLNVGSVKLSVQDTKAEANLEAETEGEVKIAVNGGYLLQVLKAVGGIAQAGFIDPHSPMVFTTDGYLALVMPIFKEQTSEAAAEAVAQAEVRPEAEDKPKRKQRVKEPVAA